MHRDARHRGGLSPPRLTTRASRFPPRSRVVGGFRSWTHTGSTSSRSVSTTTRHSRISASSPTRWRCV